MRRGTVAFIVAGLLAGCSPEAAERVPAPANRPATPDAGPRLPDRSQAERDLTPAFAECMGSGDAAKGVDPAMQDCLRDELGRQDGRLNQAWAKVLAVLEEQAKDPLRPPPEDALSPKSRTERVRTAQRDWLRYRDSKCESENQSGGQMDWSGRLDCHIGETIERTTELGVLEDSLANS